MKLNLRKLNDFVFTTIFDIKEDKESIFEDKLHNYIRRTTKADSLLTKVQFHRLGTFKGEQV